MIQKNISKSKIDLTSITENTDTVQKLIELQVEHNSKTLCVACFNILSKSSNKCESCGHCPKTQISSDLLYDDVPAEHPKEKPSIKIGEIIDENPNSRGSIKTVLEKLCEQVELGNKRKWVRPVFDGVPYRIATHLHNEVVQCLICQSVIDTKLEKIENHVKKEHAEHENLPYNLYFGEVLLAVGAGHMEKILLLDIFRFSKKLFVETIASKLGFRSKKAIEFIVNCGNHMLHNLRSFF